MDVILDSQKKVLLVEDDIFLRRLFQEMLEIEFSVTACASGEEALEKLGHFKPDIILLDIMLGGIDGYEVCKRIRANKEFSHIWIIFVTAKGITNERLKGYELGGDDYLAKPVDYNELLAKMRVFARRSKVEIPAVVNKTLQSNKRLKSFYSNDQITRMLFEMNNRQTEVVYVRAESPFCRFYCFDRDKNFCFIRTSFKEISTFFNDYNLMKIHKSYMINPNKILSLQQKSIHDFDILINSGTNEIISLPVGRTYLSDVKKLL